MMGQASSANRNTMATFFIGVLSCRTERSIEPAGNKKGIAAWFTFPLGQFLLWYSKGKIKTETVFGGRPLSFGGDEED